jgi:hypothetical protein
LDKDGNVCGVVEGIMPANYPDERMAGAASFIPGPRVSEFIDFAEQVMLKEIFPEKMFEMVVDYKKGLGSEEVEYDMEGSDATGDPAEDEKKEVKAMQKKLGDAFEERIEGLKKHHTLEEVNAILTTIRRERDEVIDIMNREGGDLDEVIARVRAKTRAIQRQILEGLDDKEKQEVAQKLGRSAPGPSDATARVTDAEFEEKKEGQ